MPKLKTKTYEIQGAEGAKKLFEAYPQLFKVVPDHSKIKKALAIGLTLPGVDLMLTPPGTGH